jgi:surface protein
MTNNLDFGRTGSVRNLTVYGPTGTIPPNPVRFPNAYLTAPGYDLSDNFTVTNGPKLNIYRSIPETRYPFTYIGTPAIQNIQYVGQINPSNAPKISVYQQVQGTLVFSYEYTGLLSLSVLASVNYLPIITGSALTIVNSNATKTENRVTVTVNINYVDDGSNFGLSFNTDDGSKTIFYNINTTNLSITTLKNIPLSKAGYQFVNFTTALNANNIPSLFADNTVIPLILPNTSFTYCFGSTSNQNNRSNFNSDISGWNTSNVTSLYSMFNNCNKFNQPLNSWNTSNVTNMTAMFIACSFFNKPLNNWLTNRVTEMRYMFHYATRFNQDLNDWDTSNVTTMEYMFSNAGAFNKNLNKWNTSRVTNMNNMFVSAGAFTNQNLPMTNDYGSYNSWSWQILPTSYTNWHSNCPLTAANAPTQLTQLVNGIRTFI